MKTLPRLILALVFLTLLTGAAQTNTQAAMSSTQLPPGNFGYEFQVSLDTTPLGDSQEQQVAYNSKHNQFLVVYQVAWQNGDHGIYATRVATPGQSLNAILIAAGGGDYLNPTVAYSATDDRYLVMWSANTDKINNPNKYDVYGRFVSWNGISLTTPKLIYTWYDRGFFSNRVVWNSLHNEFLIAWTAKVASTGYINDIAMIRVNASGDRINNEVGARILPYDGKSIPDQVDLAYSPINDQVLAAWRETYFPDPDTTRTRVAVSVLNYDLSNIPVRYPVCENINCVFHSPALIPYIGGHYKVGCISRYIKDTSEIVETHEVDKDGINIGPNSGVIASEMTYDLATFQDSAEWNFFYAYRSTPTDPFRIQGIRQLPPSLTYFTKWINAPERDLTSPVMAQDNPTLIVYQGKPVGSAGPIRLYGRIWSPWPVFIPLIAR